jgi:hypothetical protein
MMNKMIAAAVAAAVMAVGVGTAHADDPPVLTNKQIAFANQTADTTCAVFAHFNSPAGLMGIATDMVAEGKFTLQQSAQIIDYSMHTRCPDLIPAARRALDTLEGAVK